MGLLDKILGIVKSEITSEVKKAVNSKLESLSSNNEEKSAYTAKPSAYEAEEPEESKGPVFRYQDQCYNTDYRHFAQIVTADKFPEYTIEKAVHPSVFDASAHPKCYPITFLFKKEGEPKLAVFFMRTNQYKSMIAQGTYSILDDNNIKYIRFFKGFENKEDYVINRIKENLN